MTRSPRLAMPKLTSRPSRRRRSPPSTGGDVRRLTDLFGLSAARHYLAVLDPADLEILDE